MNSIFVCFLLFYRSLTQLGALQSSWQSFLQSKGSMVVITDIARQMQAKREEDATGKLPAVIDNIRLEQISLKYRVDYVLKDLNLFIPKNKTIAFVGESGSGKTTLANIIIGLIPPTSGNIWLGERLLQETDIHSYRSKIGYITQDPTIFNDTIFNNVTFFDEPSNAHIQQFWKVIELASLFDFVQSLPEKENSILGDNGILISGGQKQRISIARELYKNCELLVLDEATSALDAETENIIRENIDRLQGKYTIIIIAHRLSTIKNADTIYLLKNRYIAASGSFDELMNHSGEFKKMVQAQIF
jgi:subfamily B ATP-binding cassette protein MsbA